MSKFNRLAQYFGFAPSENEIEMVNKIRNSYKSIEVVGRGTVRIDPAEVRRDPVFIENAQKARSLVHK